MYVKAHFLNLSYLFEFFKFFLVIHPNQKPQERTIDRGDDMQ